MVFSIEFDIETVSTLAVADDAVDWMQIPPQGHIVDEWILPKFYFTGSHMPDYLMNDVGWHICSLKLVDAIASVCTELDFVRFLPVHVYTSDRIIEYYVIHIEKATNAIDIYATVYIDDAIVKPAFKSYALEGVNIFSYYNSEKIYITEQLHSRILYTDCSGISFNPCECS
ncbi:MAG: hypothetical protein BWY76_01192 [bacterium ADurb.Bin429]|nr:MAG: hypothetical protein BWY76_01192 [bacterium ADurb.Bin429]